MGTGPELAGRRSAGAASAGGRLVGRPLSFGYSGWVSGVVV